MALTAVVVLCAGMAALAQPDSNEAPWFCGPAEMPEHGFAVAVPDGVVAYDMTGDLEGQLRVVVPHAFLERQAVDEGVTHLEPARSVELPAAEARLVTYGRAGEEAAFCVGERDGAVFDIWCAGAERPNDDPLSIAAAFEWLPVPVQLASTPRLAAAIEVPTTWAVMSDPEFRPESGLSSSSTLGVTDWLMARDTEAVGSRGLMVHGPWSGGEAEVAAEVAGLLADYDSNPELDVLTPAPEPVSLPAGEARRMRATSAAAGLPGCRSGSSTSTPTWGRATTTSSS